MLLAVVVVVNLICFGPMSTMLTLATAKNASDENEGHVLAEETVSNAKDLCERIEEEGIVLLKNEENTLPLTNTKKLNVFGWSSTNPIYAGIGSGALSDVYPKVTLLDGLTNAGFELNTELSDFYTTFRDARPSVNAVCPD